MKKMGIIILIIVLIIFVSALCNILMFAIQNNGWNWFMGFGDLSDLRKEEHIKKEEKIDITDIKKINIEFRASDVNIFFTEDSQIRVVQYSYKELEDNRLFEVNKTSSSVTINESSKPRFHLFYIGFMEQSVYDVYIPKEYKESLEIKAVSGDVEVEENLKFEDLTIASTSGDIKMGNVEAKNIKIESISGDIKLGDLIDEDLRLKTVSGDIRVESAKGKIEAKTTSGTIEIKELEGNVELTSVSGDVKSDDFKVTGTSRVKTTSGNVRMYLNQESNCEIQTKSVSGNVTLPNRRNVMGIEPYVELNIETVSGNIRLEK
ncbi:MAG: DUF4097 domain-containing protein [Clostridia bacterium]|nr:DUF4097 domain-containing protein [Clostridia bacterium]